MVGGVLTVRFRIYIYIYDLDTYICILNFYRKFIDFEKNADGGGGVLTVRFRIYIYIYDLVSIQHFDGAPA